MVSHFNELSATARKFKMGEGGVQIDWCQIKNISHVFFLTSVLFCFFDNSFSKRKHFKNYLSDKFPTNYPSLFNLIELTFRCLSKQQVLASQNAWLTLQTYILSFLTSRGIVAS